MAEHPVRRKLRAEILPWIVSGRRLKQQWFYRLHTIYGFTTDAVMALSGVGLASPWLRLIGGRSAEREGGAAAAATVAKLTGTLPEVLYYPAVALVLLWILIRVKFEHESGAQRAVLAKSCAKTLGHVEVRLYRVLAKPDPMPDLLKLLDEEIFPTIDRNVQEGAYPWNGIAPGSESDVQRLLSDLCEKFEPGWNAPPDFGQRAATGGAQ